MPCIAQCTAGIVNIMVTVKYYPFQYWCTVSLADVAEMRLHQPQPARYKMQKQIFLNIH